MLSPSSYAPNPSVAFAWLWINGTSVTVDDLTQRPRHLQSFSCEFKVETIGFFEFVLFDPQYDWIEDLVTKSDGECTFKYGYTEGLQSQIYNGVILEYTPEFLYDGVRVTLRGMMSALKFNKKAVTRAWEGKALDEIATEVATNNGWTAIVDPTEKVESRDDIDETDLDHAKWQQHGTDMQFLEKLQRQAVRKKDGAGGYVLYFDHDKNEMHFHPPKYEEGPVKTFVWRNKSTEVIRFSPNYNGRALARFLVGGSTQAPSVDSSDGSTAEGMQSAHKGTGKGKTTDPARNKTSTPDSEEEWQEHRRVVKDFPDAARAQNEAKFWWYRAHYLAAFTAELVVVGDPTLKPYKKYEVQVHKATGGLHPTSGLYWAKGIKHSISGGKYESTLLFWRSDSMSGQEPNPRLK